ncbi:MAG: DUF924 family protein [Pseudomonadota bacterium]
MSTEIHPSQVLSYWFGPEPYQERKSLWWGGKKNDAAIIERWRVAVEQALAGGLEEWTATAQGNLALILLSDQLTRNVYRGTAQAFAGDAMARACVARGLERGDLAHYHPLEAVFFLMPLEHHESMESQRQALQLMRELREQCPPELRKILDSNIEYARSHGEIIERFGRFPHRNVALGRPSTPQEAAYLASGGRRFGQ